MKSQYHLEIIIISTLLLDNALQNEYILNMLRIKSIYRYERKDKMKKIISMSVLTVLVLMLFAGCSCDHQYTSAITKEPDYDNEGEKIYTCSKCGDTYMEPIDKLVRETLSTAVLDAALSSIRYYSGPFSISMGNLIPNSMENYSIQYYTGEDAIEKGYISQKDFGSSVDINNVYYAVVSGNVMVNPEIPYLTNYVEGAVKTSMIFDDNGQLISANVTLCNNLETCAILMMTSG